MGSSPLQEDTKKSILITGCSSGCGKHAAVALKAKGWRVFAACRKQAGAHRCENQRPLRFEANRAFCEAPLGPRRASSKR